MSPGIYTLVEGGNEATYYLEHGDEFTDRMLVRITNDIAEFARDRLEELAPGAIGEELVDMERAVYGQPGVIEATAGVLPDITKDLFDPDTGDMKGVGSDPADYPVFVDVGTGVYGEYGRPITSMPGNVMVFYYYGRKIITKETKGQRAQHYSDRSYEETVRWVPVRLRAAGFDPRD